jgi:hypothetical protein
MSLDGIRGAGIARESAFAFYGNGLLPVIRLELSDSGLFDAAVERIEEKADKQLMVGEANGASYKYANVEDFNLIIATLEQQAIITVVPASYDSSQVARALGMSALQNNLQQSKALQAIGKEYGFSEYMTGYINIERIAGIFAGKANSQDEEFFAAIGNAPPEISEACAAEILEVAAIAPRIVFGYSEMSSERVASSLIIELRDDIAQGLATIPAHVPGLGADFGGLMSFGLGLSPLALREFFEARLDALEADPFECEKFGGLQAGVAKGRAAMQQPVPPVVYGFRGFVANIYDIQGMDMMSKTLPESIDASILIAVENAESLIMMAAAFDPQIAALNLLPDGKPVKLDMAQLAAVTDTAFAALSSDALSISLGAGAEKGAADMLTADSADPAPLMSMSMDSARYYSMIGEAMSSEGAGESGNALQDAIQVAMRDVILLSGSMYDRMSVDVQLTERGIEIGAIMDLSE